MGDRPLKKRLKKSSAEPDGQAGQVNGRGGRGVMGLNPLVGHKVDRFWADVSFRAFPQRGFSFGTVKVYQIVSGAGSGTVRKAWMTL